MRVLWFSITSSLYFGNSVSGSWVEALERIVRHRPDCELAIAFQSDRPLPQKKDENVTYYPLYFPRSRFQLRYVDSYTSRFTDRFLMDEAQRVIADFFPDIIQVFGTEWAYGLLPQYTQIPVVVHLQGIWTASRAIIAEQKSTRTLWDYMHDEHRPQMWWAFLRHRHRQTERAEREEKILAMNKFYMSRTRWDEALVHLFSPDAICYYCSEALRSPFVQAKEHCKPGTHGTCRLLTVGNSDMSKGYPLIFQTARLLREHGQFPYEWRLIGVDEKDLAHVSRRTGLHCNEIGLKPMGPMQANDIVGEMQSSDIFVQASITDNSPNAMCEAQYMGMPTLSTQVGGVPSLLSDEYDKDLQVPLYDPYYLAAKIIELYQDKDRMRRLGQVNREIAMHRHSDEAIERELFTCYENIIKKSKEL